jgi:uroporphyrin-III C-methyltransferase
MVDATDDAPPDVHPGDEERRASAGIRETGGGTVSLVGSGPGHPDLLTRRAWRRLAEADVVLHDSLTGDEILDELPETVEVIDVGKRPPDRTPQEEINRLMAERSRRGERVVRLKGGDPTVFGRGGEEAEYLASENVDFEFVPGVSSVLAAPSVSGIPLTHRDHSSSLTVITGHETPDKEESALDWSALADTITDGGTLVILMGVRRLSENVRALRSHGVPPETPAAMVQKATWSGEQTVVGTLSSIAEERRTAGIESPAVTIVGDVVNVRRDVKERLCE